MSPILIPLGKEKNSRKRYDYQKISSNDTNWGFPCGSLVKNPPAMQETQVESLGQEDLLEKGIATHSNILTWRIPGTKEPGGLQSMGSQRARHS